MTALRYAGSHSPRGDATRGRMEHHGHQTWRHTLCRPRLGSPPVHSSVRLRSKQQHEIYCSCCYILNPNTKTTCVGLVVPVQSRCGAVQWRPTSSVGRRTSRWPVRPGTRNLARSTKCRLRGLTRARVGMKPKVVIVRSKNKPMGQLCRSRKQDLSL